MLRWRKRMRSPKVLRRGQLSMQPRPLTGATLAQALHFLAIGISDYGDKATSLRLKFAANDANDVGVLLATQGSVFNRKGGIYAQYLRDRELGFSGRSFR